MARCFFFWSSGFEVLGGSFSRIYIRSPIISNPNIFSFWYRRSGTSATHSFVVETSTDNSNWSQVGSYSGTMSTTYAQFTVDLGALSLTNIFVRVRDTRSSGSTLWYIDDMSWTSTVVSNNVNIIQGNAACNISIICGQTYNVYDVGGINDNYNNSMTSRPLVLSPASAGGIVNVNISTIGIEVQNDGLVLYNNNTNAVPLFASTLGNGAGTSPPPNGAWWGTSGAPGSRTSTHSSGAITLDLLSNGSSTGTGFAGTVTCTVPQDCSGQPNSGTAAITATSGCASTNFTLSATGLSVGALGLSYQWESAPSNTGPWTPINGATSSSFSTSTTTTTFYRLVSTCSFSGQQNFTNEVSFTVTGSPCTCAAYTVFSATNAFDTEISNVTVGSMNNSSACTTVAPGPGSVLNRYSNFTTTVTGPVQAQGSSVNFSLTQTTCSDLHSNFFQIYVDWNQDGDFSDAGEQVYSQTTSVTGNHTVTGTFNVPLNATIGTTRMRVVCNEATASTANFAQTNYSWGETEDYCFNVLIAQPCTGTPSPGNTLATATSIPSGNSTNLSLQNSTSGLGVTYQWFSSTVSATGPWTSISGANSSTLSATPSAASTWYYCAVTCDGNTGNSNPVQINLTYCSPTNTGTATSIISFSTTNGITNITNNLTNYSGSGYNNYSNLSVSQFPGSSINFSLNLGGGSAGIRIWVDWNNNLSFEASELMYNSNAFMNTGITTGSFTVPVAAAVGSYRMRVMVDYSTQTPAPCAFAFSRGEIEDYTFIVSSPCASPSTQATNVNVSGTTAATTTINWTSGNGNGALVVLRATATSNVLPNNGTVYTANTSFGLGTGTAITGTGNFVVFVGSGNSVNVSGLSSNTSYTATVYEYNTVDQCYNLSGASVVFTTPCAPFQGTYSVGAGNIPGEDGHYNTLTAAIADYNTRCITGPLVFLLTDATYSTGTGETFPLSINSNSYASSVNTLTIKPNTGVNSTITANSTTATIVLNGADFVTIDGSNGNTVNSVCPRVKATRNLTVINTNTASSQRAVIWLQTPASTTNGATNNTIRNCIVQGNSSITTEFGIGSADNTIQSLDVNGGTSHNNNTIENNAVSKVKNGIYSVGKSTSNRNTGTRILLNDVFECSQIGVFTGFENGTLISGNTISDITTTASSTVCGIGVGAAFVTSANNVESISEGINTVITHNIINNVSVGNTYSALGIVIGKSNTGTTTISNNMINGIRANGTISDYCAGIHLGGGTAQINLYHNTISMDGTITGSTAASVTSACVAICNSTFRVDAKNNILSNTQTGNSGATVRFACWAIQGSPNFDQTNKLLTSNFNNLFCAGSGPGSYQIGLTGGITGVPRTTINNWRTDCAQDANSVNVAPLFVGTNDLHLQAVAGNSSLDNTGTPIVSVTNDIDCETRSATTPDIGADEFSITQCTGTPTAGTAAISLSSGCASSTFTLSATNLSVGAGISYQWQSSPTGLPNTWTNINGATSATLNTSTTSTLFYQLVTTCANGGGTNSTNIVSYTVSGNPCSCLNYPANYASNTADNDLTTVTVGTMTNNSSCGDLAPGAGSIAFRYGNYTGSVTGPSANQGASVNFSLTETLCASGTPNQNYFLIYIDWNQDGDFADADEKVFSQIDAGPTPTVVSTQTVTGSFVVPMTALTGVTRMRVINTTGSFASFNYAQSNPFTTGETEDYCFTVTAASGPSCPNASSIAPSGTQNICQNGTTNQLTVSYTTGGLTGTPTPLYQWYSNTTNSNLISSATLIVGATSSTFTPPSNTVGTLYYFCVVYATDNGCNQTNATQSLASNAVQVTIVDPNTAYNSSDFGTVASVSTGSTVNHLVISQVYGGGSASYPFDFIELYNPTASTISIDNLTLQFQTQGTSTTWTILASLSGSIPSGGFFLVHLTTNSGSTATPVTADLTNTSVGINANDGKITLVNSTTALPAAAASCISNLIIDKVGYGSTSQPCNETQNAPTPSSNSIIRSDFCNIDTDNNSVDFDLQNPPAPRNSSTLPITCLSSSPTSFCQSGTPGAMSVTGVSGGSSYTYQWYERSGLQTCPTGNSTLGWTLIPGATAATYTPSSPISASTTYACLVTINGSPCNATRWANDCVQITIHPNPIPVISGNTALCSAGSLNLSASTASSYVWTPNGQTTQNITVNSTGTYGVTVTDSNGCTGNTSVVVNAAANAVINLITSP